MITISGQTENLETLMKVLAFPKGDDMVFPYRKIVIQKKPEEQLPYLIARQLASAGTIYSQVLIKPDDSASPFLNLSGEGDIMFDMKKALKNINELRTYKEAYIEHDPETGITIFGSSTGNTDSEKYRTREPMVEIDDASGILRIPCDCGHNPSCSLCNGQGAKPAAPLNYKNNIALCRSDSSLYADAGIKFEIESNIMRTIGDKSVRFGDTFPLQFQKDALRVLISDPDDITTDGFEKVIPVTYLINKMEGKQIWIDDFYKHIFGNLTEKITIWSANLPPEEESIYVTMNKPGGFHCGIQIQAKSQTG